jgi:hypothetical protein
MRGAAERRRVLWFPALLLMALCCAYAAAARGAGEAPEAEPPVEDELFPIRRVLLRPAQLADELERVRRGVLLQMPRSEFEGLIRRASAVRRDQSPPVLVEARYQASLIGDALVGTARWRIVASGDSPALLPVEPLNLAVRNARWAEDRAAVLGDLDPRQKVPGAELLIDRPGDQALAVEWSARGLPEPGGVRFDWRAPPCAVSTLDLELPPGYEPLCQRDGCLITGPTPAAAPDRRTWRLLFGGASQLELLIRPPADAGPRPLVLVRQQNVQELSPGQSHYDFSLDLDVRHGGVRELRLEYDPALRPIDVNVRNLARWHILEPDEDTPSQIAVEFSEPFRGGALTLRGVGPVLTNRPWVSPWVRVAGGVPRGEQIVVRVHPELAYEDWKAGSFRLQDAAASADRAMVWTLQGGAVRAAPNRPSARFRLRGPEYQVRQQLWWHVAPGGGETLSAHCAFDVRRGPVFQVPWAVPGDWDVWQVEADVADSLAGWSVLPPAVSGGPATLMVEFLRPLGPASTTQLQISLSRRRRGLTANARTIVTAPDVRPLAAEAREGTLAVKIAADVEASWAGGDNSRRGSPVRPADTAAAAPWGPAPPDFVFNLGPRGVDGTLALRPVRSRYRADGRTHLTVVGRNARITHLLALQPLSGASDTILVRTTADDRLRWEWSVVSGINRVRGVYRLDLASAVARVGVGALSPWAALTAPETAKRGGDALMAISLERPLAEPVELQADLHLLLPPASDAARAAATVATIATDAPLPSLTLAASSMTAGEWPVAVPLISAPAASGGAYSITVDLAASAGLGARTSGVTEQAAADSSRQLRHFIAGPGPALLSLVPAGVEAAAGIITTATLRTDAGNVDRQLHHLYVRLQDCRAEQFAVGLPNDAIVQRVLLAGAVAPVKAPVQTADGLDLAIGLPRGGPEIGLEVVFVTPQRPWNIATELSTPIVRLPAQTRVGHVWHFPPGVAPVRQTGWRTRPAAPDRESLSDGTANNVDWTSEDQLTRVWVVREADITEIGFILSAVAAVGIALSGARTRLVLIGVAATTGLLMIWLPPALRPAAWWPFVMTAIIAIGGSLGRAAPRRGHASCDALTKSPSSRKRVLAGAAIATWIAASGRAAGPPPATVYLVPGPDGDVTTVLVPPDLIDQLRNLERTGVAALADARVTAARYTGRIDDGVARLQARFEVQCFAEGAATVSLPLTGVGLRDGQLDGIPAYPRAAGDRYTIEVRGRGRHLLDLTLQIPVAGAAEDKEVRFGGPDLPQSTLALDLPVGARMPHAVARRGAQKVTEAGGRPHLEADLGRAATIHVRWKTAATEASPAAVAVREAYLWDISAAGATLQGALRYSVSGGSVSSLAVDLPKDLLVASVDARPLDAAVSGTASGRLHRWHVADLDRGSRLILEFGAPVTGNWQITFSLVPKAPWPAGVTLSFPSAEDKKSAPAAYAYRARDLAVSLTRTTGLTPLAEELFLRDHWQPAQVEADAPRPTRAFLRSAGGVPTLRLTIAPPAPEVASIETWTWRVGPEFAEVHTESRVSAHGGAVFWAQWELPPELRLTDLRGPDVLQWTRTGPRLQVWFRKAITDTSLQWNGSVDRTVRGPGSTHAVVATRFDLPTIRPVAMPFHGTINVSAVDGWLLNPQQTAHLRPGETSQGGRPTWEYLSEAPNYQATFQLRPAFSDDQFRLTTVAGMREDGFRAETTIEFLGSRAEREPIIVTARPAGSVQYRINAPGARVREILAVTDGRAWMIDGSASRPERVIVSATAQATRPDDRPPEWLLPRVEVVTGGRRPGRLSHTVTLDGGLAPVEVEGLRATGQFNAWAVHSEGWVLRVRPVVGPRHAEVQSTYVASVRDDDGRWHTRMTNRLAAPPGAQLRWTWPAPVRLRRITVDEGRFVPTGRPITEYVFSLDDRPGNRTLILEWTTDGDRPPIAENELPRLFAGDVAVPTGPVKLAVAPSAPSTDWTHPASRTVLLIGLLSGGVWWTRRFGDALWPARLVVLAAAGWAAAGGWYWVLAVAVGVTTIGTAKIRDAARRRRLPASPSALSS